MNRSLVVARFSVVISALIVTGCATLSEDECRVAQWSDIGFRDGRHGKPEDRIDEHVKACAKVQVVPDREAYFAGREAGLEPYCTRHNGFEVGRSGDEYENVCRRKGEREFLEGYSLGQAVHRARERLDHVDSEIEHVEKMLKAKDTSEADHETANRRRIELEGERGAAREALRRLEWEAESI